MQILQRLWLAWKRFGLLLGDIIARIVLTIFYFSIFMPFGLGVRLLSDPLDIRHARPATWSERTTSAATLENARRL